MMSKFRERTWKKNSIPVTWVVFFSLIFLYNSNSFASEYFISSSPSGAEYGIGDLQDLIDSSKGSVANPIIFNFAPGTYRIGKTIRIEKKSFLSFTSSGEVIFESDSEEGKKKVPKLFEPGCGASSKKSCEHWRGEGEWSSVYLDNFSYSLFRVLESSHISFTNIGAREVYPSAFIFIDSSNITVSNGQFVGGSNVVVVKGEESNHFTFSKNTWEQDPTAKIWLELDWSHVHHGKFNYFNGAFMQGRNVGADFKFLGNSFSHAFNAIRSKISNSECLEDPENCHLNKQFLFEGNTFFNIADNSLEPEKFFRDWKVVNNWFYGMHAPFSLDGTSGRDGFLVEGNQFVSDVKPRQYLDMGNCTDWAHDFGRVFKFGEDYPDIDGIHIKDNKWMLDYGATPGEFMNLADGKFPEDAKIQDAVLEDLVSNKKMKISQEKIDYTCR